MQTQSAVNAGKSAPTLPARITGAATALATLALLAAAMPAAHAQNYFDTDGVTIGQVSGETYIGQNNPDPFTVYTDAATQSDAPIGAYGQSTLEVNGGSVGDNLYAKGSSIVNLRSGYVDGAGYCDTNATLNMSGGSIGDFFCYGAGTANITGGQLRNSLIVKEDGVLSLFGSGISRSLLNADFELDGESYSQFSLSGFLRDGTDITGLNAYVRNNDNSLLSLFDDAYVPPVVPNGGFETGNLKGWKSSGAVSVNRKFDGDISPVEGNYQAVLLTGRVSVSKVESTLGLTSGTLNSFGTPLTYGSTLYQDVFVNAGQAVTFNYAFKTGDYYPYNDSAFFTISNNAEKLSDVLTVGDYGYSGWRSFSYKVNAAGTYRIGYSVFSGLDNSVESYLLVDNVNIVAVPEPGSVAFGVIAVGGVLSLIARKRKS